MNCTSEIIQSVPLATEPGISIIIPPLTYEHMQIKLDDLWKESKKAGLEIDSSKTEEIRVNTVVNQGGRSSVKHNNGKIKHIML